MSKIIRSIYTFYLNHFFVGLCISLSCIWLYTSLGYKSIAILCWYKAITIAIFFYSVNKRKRNEFFYYQNLGVSKWLLWGVTLGIDILLFIIMMVLTNHFNHA